MRFKIWQLGLMVAGFATTVVALSSLVTAQKAEVNPEQLVSLRGTIIDLTCAAMGKATLGTWVNTGADHVMPDGTTQENCAAMCLRGGQPAALFSDGKITAVFACNPRGGGELKRVLPHGNAAPITRSLSAPVEVEGLWAGEGTNVFVPVRIRGTTINVETRYGRGGWHVVDCSREGIPFSDSDSLVPNGRGLSSSDFEYWIEFHRKRGQILRAQPGGE